VRIDPLKADVRAPVPQRGGVRGNERQRNRRVEERQRRRHREAGWLGIGKHDVLAAPDGLQAGCLGVLRDLDRDFRIRAGAVVHCEQAELHARNGRRPSALPQTSALHR
jgi:hypothetical protein